jgi:transcriptional regulator with XRE-family HTH domain
MAKAQPTPFGRLLRYRRKMLGMSQEELASRAEVSVRHLSYVETGRSSPSKEMVIAVAYALGVEDVGLYLEAAGFLAPYPDVELTSPQMASFRGDLRRIVDAQLHPALAHDRFGTILHYNELLAWTVQLFTDRVRVGEQSSGHKLLAELMPVVANWDEVAALYRRRLFREIVRGSGDVADEILEQLYQQLDAPDHKNEMVPSPITPIILERRNLRLSFDSVTVTLGTPQDIGLRNFRMVLFMPNDDVTHRRLDERLAETLL